LPVWINALRLTGVGFFIVGCIVAGVLAGIWLDNRFGTSPWLVLLGLAAGLTAAGMGVYRMLLPLLKDAMNKEKR